jgi:hypothetical protein
MKNVDLQVEKPAKVKAGIHGKGLTRDYYECIIKERFACKSNEQL